MKIIIAISSLLMIAICFPLSAQTWTGTTTTGNVGIGTTNTTNVKLSVEGNGDWTMRMKDNSGSGVDWYVGSTGTAYAAGSGKLLFSPSASSTSAVLTLTNTGKIGLGSGIYNPRATVDAGYSASGALAMTFARLTEGDGSNTGTFLGVRTYDTQPTNAKSFALEHSFYGLVNNSINFCRGGGTTGGFMTFNTNANNEAMRIYWNGSVCIGTTATNGYKLAVEGTIGAREVNVNTSTWSDYVFDKEYNLLPLTEVEKYIAAHHHLPEVPSAADVEANGVNVGEINAILLKKIEELTLHIINQEKRINELEKKADH